MSTLLGGVTAGLAGQNAQGGATAAENEVLNNSLGDHRSEEQKDEDQLKEELSQERAKLSGGQEIIGYDAEGNPEYAYKPSPSMFGPGGSTGSSQGASGNTVRVGGGSAFEADVGNGANDWNDAPTTSNAPLGLGSTGRSAPNNLQEQLALQQAMSNPAAGVQLPIPMGDSRWPSSAGWVKMSQNVNGIEIHYVRNVNSGAVDDFKFK